MSVVRASKYHHIKLTSSHHGLHIGVHPSRITIGTKGVASGSKTRSMGVAQRHDVGVWQGLQCLNVLDSHHAGANDGIAQCGRRASSHGLRVEPRQCRQLQISADTCQQLYSTRDSFGVVLDDRFYFRQLLSGRDFAHNDDMARQMVNFVYAIGDRQTGDCVLIDPAYDVNGLIDAVEADGLRLTGVLATHYHPDHVGGSMMGMRIDGIASLLERCSVPIHVQQAEV